MDQLEYFIASFCLLSKYYSVRWLNYTLFQNLTELIHVTCCIIRNFEKPNCFPQVPRNTFDYTCWWLQSALQSMWEIFWCEKKTNHVSDHIHGVFEPQEIVFYSFTPAQDIDVEQLFSILNCFLSDRSNILDENVINYIFRRYNSSI